MKKLFLLALLVLATLARAATGDIMSVTVLANGWQADIVIQGLGTGGTYSFGLGTNNNPATGTPKVVFTVVSLAYDDTGAATTNTRTIYGTHAVRKPYPNEAQNEESFSTNTTVRISLSDYIYAKDNTGGGNSGTAPVVSILAGLYTQTAVPNNASGASFAVTNNSTAVHQTFTANWSEPPFQRITGNFNLHALAFHGSGQNARPARAVKFTVSDTSGNTVTTTVLSPTVDPTQADPVPVVEFVGAINVSTLTQGNILTCNFIAYPWVGDAGAVLDTSTGTAQPTPLFGPITFLNDKSNTYGVTCALVDPTGSDAGANTVYDAASFNPSTAYKFLTIGKAASAIAAYNNTNHSRNDVGAGEVHLNDGSYNWTGSSNTYGAANPVTWLTIKRASTSSARSAVLINGQSGNNAIRNKVKFQDLSYASNATITVDAQTSFWMDNCSYASTGLAPIYTATVTYLTRVTVGVVTSGLQQFSTENMAMALIRGCTFSGFDSYVSIYTVVGNLKANTAPIYFRQNTGSGPAAPVNCIFAFNKITAAANTDYLVQFARTNTQGLAVVQNLLENTNNTQPVLFVGADGNTNVINNALIWNNTATGQRCNMAYNDTGSTSTDRLYWSVKNNIWEDDNIKSDTFATANGARIGNWPQLYGVGYSGNFDCEVTGSNLGAGGSFQREFLGLKSYEPATTGGQPPGTGTNAITYVEFRNRLSRTQAGSGTGGGDYRLTKTSPALGMQRDWLLPYDLAGVPRTSVAPPGAYAMPPSSKGWLFFF